MDSFKDQIKGNMNMNGGGLAVNITGKYESNRHAIARSEKYTFGEWSKYLKSKKGGCLIIDAKQLLQAYRAVNGEPEWHHAGFLPKSYGGGMKKTYFISELIEKKETIAILKKYTKIAVKLVITRELSDIRRAKQIDFLKTHGKQFSRVAPSELPNFSVDIYSEMLGKYGWFEADNKYTLTEYHSGWHFENEDILNEYKKI